MPDPTQQAIEIIVHGHPEPGGSKQAQPVRRGNVYLHDKSGRPIVNVADANPRAAKWKKHVAQTATEQYSGPLLEGPLVVSMEFFVHRWKSHYGTGKNARRLKDSAPFYPGGDHADALKFARPVEDALTGVVWVDDAWTTDLVTSKRYVDGYCVKIEPGKWMPGEKVIIRIMQHAVLTVGEHRLAGQLVLA